MLNPSSHITALYPNGPTSGFRSISRQRLSQYCDKRTVTRQKCRFPTARIAEARIVHEIQTNQRFPRTGYPSHEADCLSSIL
jgi:hypothetical protein